jgi:tetratricopeptide (TPR) repeat protein
MNIVKHIKKLLKEAELYQDQGLLNEARERYLRAAGLIKTSDQLKNSQNLLKGITRKIKTLKKDVESFEKSPITPAISADKQDVIKKLFSFENKKDGKDPDLDGSIILAKFGQYERALEEFTSLLKTDALRVVAAKNILRCHIAISSADNAIRQFQEWEAEGNFTSDQLGKVRIFLKSLLKKNGVEETLPEEEIIPDIGNREETGEEDIIDISSIGINLEKGPQEGKLLELDVSFQTGNVISLLISGKDKVLIDAFKEGTTLRNMQLYSPIAMFQGSGIVKAKTQISSGPKRGDYSVDIKITTT